jgi:hypothetical protein
VILDESGLAHALVLAAAMLIPAVRPAAGAAGAVPCPAGPDPFEVRLVPTAHANGAVGVVRLRFADSPFGVTVTPDGSHLYDADLSTSGLDATDGALVVWAATPELDRVQKLGTLDERGMLSGRIAFNKFLVFVTAEPHADVARWTGRILLRGISPSGRLHTMAGHGPFQAESCGGVFSPYDT